MSVIPPCSVKLIKRVDLLFQQPWEYCLSTFSQKSSSVLSSPAYGCVNLDKQQAEPDPEAELRRKLEAHHWILIKKKFYEQKKAQALNPGQHARRNPEQNRGRGAHGLKAKNRRTRNTEAQVRMNCPGSAGPMAHNDRNQTSLKQVYAANKPHVTAGNDHTYTSILPSLPDRPSVQLPLCYLSNERVSGDSIPEGPDYIPPTGLADVKMCDDNVKEGRQDNSAFIPPTESVPIKFYYGNRGTADCKAKATQTRPHCTTDMRLEMLNLREKDSESLYNELDETQMMDINRDEDSMQL